MDQKTIAVLLGTIVGNISKHLNNKFENGELSEKENKINPNNSTNSRIPLISSESKRQPILYDFDAILTVAFSVNSNQAILKLPCFALVNLAKARSLITVFLLEHVYQRVYFS